MAENMLSKRFFNTPFSYLPTLWSDFFNEGVFPTTEDFSQRGVQIYEENNQLHVEVPLPGLTLNDIEVTITKGNVLYVKGEAKEETEDKKKKIYRSSKRNYSYSLILPTQIDEKQEPQAVYADGILNISLQLPKQGETKRITVKSGSSKK